MCSVICINCSFSLNTRKQKDEIQLEPSETKPILCKALREIGDKCTDVISKCFSNDDVQQMRYNHVEQMSKVGILVVSKYIYHGSKYQ